MGSFAVRAVGLGNGNAFTGTLPEYSPLCMPSGLAHAGTPANASSQFYIMKAASPGLDGDFTVFGRVTAGMAVVDALKFEDILKLATIK